LEEEEEEEEVDDDEWLVGAAVGLKGERSLLVMFSSINRIDLPDSFRLGCEGEFKREELYDKVGNLGI
jgi:hypothetical protein